MSNATVSPGTIVSDTQGSGGGSGASLAAGYLTGLQMWKTGDTTLTVASGRARDQGNVRDLVLGADTGVDFSVLGINGRDANLPNARAIVYAWLVGGASVATGVLISASETAPTFPAGYTEQRFIGSIPVEAGEGPRQVDWMQQGYGLSREVRLGPYDLQEALVGGPWPTAPGQIPAVTASTSWRNIVAGGQDVNFAPSERIPARPAGAGGVDARRGIRVILLFITRTNNNDFIEVAAAHGNNEVPTSSPLNGNGNTRSYQIGPNLTEEYFLQVGDNQSFQYRCTAGNINYLFTVAGWVDEL